MDSVSDLVVERHTYIPSTPTHAYTQACMHTKCDTTYTSQTKAISAL